MNFQLEVNDINVILNCLSIEVDYLENQPLTVKVQEKLDLLNDVKDNLIRQYQSNIHFEGLQVVRNEDTSDISDI
jgi:hypothetical protein